MKNYVKSHWNECESGILKPVWKLYKDKYKLFGIEYGDFSGIAFEILSKEMPKYQSSKSGISTYGIKVLKRRMSDYIRNNFQTDKTKANFCPASLNIPISKDSETELEDTLVDPNTLYVPENNIAKIKRFYRTLSGRQRDVLFLKTIGLAPDEIQTVLDITPKEYSDNMKKIRSPRRVSRLKNEVNINGKNSRNM